MSRPRASWIVAAVLLVAVAIVFHGALAYFFAQDDFAGLARARGLMPKLTGAWRCLSGQVWFDFMARTAGLNPLPYRLAGLMAHVVTAWLVYRWARTWVAPASALLGAMFFAVHPASYSAIYSISSIGEILMALFAVAALILAGKSGPLAWLAVPCFALSLLCKETSLLLPVVALLEHRHRTKSWLAPVPLALFAVAIAFFATLASQDVFSVRRGDNLAYAASPAALLPNLVTYARWIVDACILTMQSFSDAVDPSQLVTGAIVLFVLAALAFFRPLRERGYGIGMIAALVFLLPVLPLRNHTYHYYLYAPLVGVALAAAALWDQATTLLATKRDPARDAATGVSTMRAWTWAGVVAALLVVNGAMVVRKIENYPFLEGLRADGLVDRALIAERVFHDLDAARLPDGARLRFWSPVSMAIERERRPGADPAQETYWEQNVRQAVLDGMGIRVLLPQVREVTFVRSFEPSADSILYAVYRPDGHLGVTTVAALDSMLRSQPPAAGTEP